MFSERFIYTKYVVRAKAFKPLQVASLIHDPLGNLVLYAEGKRAKFTEEIFLYTSEDKQKQVMVIRRKRLQGLSVGHDVFLSPENEKIGAIKMAIKPTLLLEYLFLDARDEGIGFIRSENPFQTFIGVFLTFLPQTYSGFVSDQKVCTFKLSYHLLSREITVDFSRDVKRLLDRRLGIAAAVLWCALR